MASHQHLLRDPAQVEQRVPRARVRMRRLPLDDIRMETDVRHDHPRQAIAPIARRQPAHGVEVVALDLVVLRRRHTRHVQATARHAAAVGVGPGPVEVDVHEVVPCRIAHDATVPGGVAVPRRDRTEAARVHGRLACVDDEPAGRDRARDHHRGDPRTATGRRRPLLDTGEVARRRRGRHALTLVGVVRQGVDRPGRMAQHRVHGPRRGVVLRTTVGEEHRVDALCDRVGLVVELLDAVTARVDHGVVAVGVGHRDGRPVAHAADPRQVGAHAAADGLVVAGGEHAAAVTHEGRDARLLRRRDRGGTEAEQPQLVVVRDRHRRGGGGEVEGPRDAGAATSGTMRGVHGVARVAHDLHELR